MRAVIQRVVSASVTVEGRTLGAINSGLLVLLGIAEGDSEADGAWLAQKTAALRVFEDSTGKMNLALSDMGGDALVVSQFTLTASTRKGARPSFNAAAKPEVAIPLYRDFVRRLETILGRPVPTGEFGASMQLALVNDGPVTLVLDSRLRE